MRVKVNPITWIPDDNKPAWTGIPAWTQEEHDSDLDGVPNYLDISPLNPNIGRQSKIYKEEVEE